MASPYTLKNPCLGRPDCLSAVDAYNMLGVLHYNCYDGHCKKMAFDKKLASDKMVAFDKKPTCAKMTSDTK